jgi:hypothetical protein
MEPDGRDEVEAEPELDALTSEPPVFGEPRSSVLTYEGSIESERAFLRGLGAKRVKVVVFGIGVVLLLLALVAALDL